MSNEDIPPSRSPGMPQEDDTAGLKEFTEGLDAILTDQLGQLHSSKQLGVQAAEDQPKSLDEFISKKAQGQILPNDDLLRNMIREDVLQEPVDIEDPDGVKKKKVEE